jgi:hypothetical protein
MNVFSRIFRRLSPPQAAPAVPHTMFRASDMNEEIAREGLVIFPWLDAAEMDALAQTVRDASEGVDVSDVHIPTNFRLSAFSNDGVFKARLYERVYALLSARLEKLLPGYEPLVINVFEKHPESGYDPVPIHQNPSFVREPEHRSVSLWIPLQDVSKQNGTLGVLRGSHGRFNLMRAGNMPHEDVFATVGPRLESDDFEALEVRRGEAVALDDSIIHWSYPNVSNKARIAVQLIMVPREAKHIYFYYNQDKASPSMDLYEVDKDFFFGFNCKARPQGLKKVGNVPYVYDQITERDLFAGRG